MRLPTQVHGEPNPVLSAPNDGSPCGIVTAFQRRQASQRSASTLRVTTVYNAKCVRIVRSLTPMCGRILLR
ncbi:hypothetical protein [Paenibacillus sp. VTT E-133291]|uniref:hypothetical protein n=1 Tax=Paenibacillus sp. VTT E-133291 TaxID=1986223 RepID=UPI00117DDD7A|nr:hypothetical protein [Paenibacillus sp. VTT E-133291]